MTSESLSQERAPSSSALVKSEYFKHAQNVTIGDNANLSTVQGNQNVYYNLQEQKKVTRYIVGTREEEAEYEQFHDVLRSDVVALRDVHHGPSWRFDHEKMELVEYGEQRVVAAEVRIGGVPSRCVAVSYSGEGAEERWKEKFRRLGGARRPENAQLVAINLSRIPMLILTGDLVPAAHLVEQVGGLGRMYLGALAWQMGCWEDDSLWMDTSRGVFCRGPEGPQWGGSTMELDNLSLDAEIIKEDVLYRYFGGRNFDRGVVDWLAMNYDSEVSQVKVDQPTVISALDNTTLAVGNGSWKESSSWWTKTSLGEGTELPNGGTRFTLEHNGHWLMLELERKESRRDWLAQALSVFHAHGISLEGGTEAYKLLLPTQLKGELSQSRAKQRRRQKCSPIYLFLSTSIFWSFDQDSQTPIPADLCRYLGLPPSLSPKTEEFVWGTSDYKILRDYQIACEFDPTTTGFARHNEYRIYEVVKNPLTSRFEEIDDSESGSEEPRTESTHQTETELEDMSLGLLFGDTQPAADLKAPEDCEGFLFAVYRTVLVLLTKFTLFTRTWMLTALAVFLILVPYLVAELMVNLRGSLQVRSWVAAIAH